MPTIAIDLNQRDYDLLKQIRVGEADSVAWKARLIIEEHLREERMVQDA